MYNCLNRGSCKNGQRAEAGWIRWIDTAGRVFKIRKKEEMRMGEENFSKEY